MTDERPAPQDVQASFCATLVDEWIRLGVRHAVVAPGSRSTPLALAVTERDELAVHVVHDERAAAFVALGIGQTGGPALLICTSGTAAANFTPAVVEAGLSAVPLIVLTADRPPELRDVGAAQTIDQTHLYGRSARWFHDPGVADAATRPTWRRLARQAAAAALEGPVHLNLPMREPLVGTATVEPDPLGPDAAPAAPEAQPGRESEGIETTDRPDWTWTDWGVPGWTPPAWVDTERGVILAGGGHGADADDVADLARSRGWPIIADPLSGLRTIADVTCGDLMARHERFASTHRPDVVIRLGRPPASRLLNEWFAGIPTVQVGGPGTIDPDGSVRLRLSGRSLFALAPHRPPAGGQWQLSWIVAAMAIDDALVEAMDLDEQPPLTEPGVARTIADSLDDDHELVVASSMPVRDLEWYGGMFSRARANRGANGIDGVMSTALGVALGTGRPTVVVVGDIAFVHDAGALTALAQRDVDLRIVVIDNDGGGIFSFLPQAGQLEPSRFEQLFGTPHGTDVAMLAQAHGLRTTTVTAPFELAAALDEPGPAVIRVVTDRAANVAEHRRLHDAMLAALDDRLGADPV